MLSKDDQFLQQLRATFKVEADEHVQAMSACLLKLEKSPDPESRTKVLETIFRAAHSLKGAARAVDLGDIESICQVLEDVLAFWKRRQTVPSSTALDTLHRALDGIGAMLATTENIPGRAVRPELSLLRQSLRQLITPAPSLAAGKLPAAAPERVTASPFTVPVADLPVFPPPVSIPPVSTAPIAAPGFADPPITGTGATLQPSHGAEQSVSVDTVRVSVEKLEAQLLQAEELLAAKLAAGQRVTDLRELIVGFDGWKKAWAAVEPDVYALRQAQGAAGVREGHASPGLNRLLDFFERSLDALKSIESRAGVLVRVAEQDRHSVGKLVDDMLEDSKKLLLLPFSTISTSFPKLVRDLCRDQGKEADFVIRGEDIEIDKRILEEMKDPLVHILRNSIDHGIEMPRVRSQRGKQSRASIVLDVSQVNGNKVQILLSDDGGGIDTSKVKDSAIRHGLSSEEEAKQLDESAAHALIFRSQVSTSPIITELSGRGLGLAIVQEKVDKLGGQVSVESRPGLGTAFRIILPAVRARFHGILVEVAGRSFIVPTVQVERVGRVRPDDIRTVEGRETISVDGRAVALVHLADALELPLIEQKRSPDRNAVFLILGGGDGRVAFAVDAVLYEQEVLVKPLRKPLSRVRNISGAAVLGSGQVTPILNVADLLKTARKLGGASARMAAAAKTAQTAPKSILIAEDSITSRMLLKGILESAGYNVKVAVDGMEAYTMLRTEKFELLVSDVEMPRLNGFDLTARIRADNKLAELPVVLVTALETREDRERGIDVGANAYIVKRSFDQSNLVEAVRRLI